MKGRCNTHSQQAHSMCTSTPSHTVVQLWKHFEACGCRRPQLGGQRAADHFRVPFWVGRVSWQSRLNKWAENSPEKRGSMRLKWRSEVRNIHSDAWLKQAGGVVCSSLKTLLQRMQMGKRRQKERNTENKPSLSEKTQTSRPREHLTICEGDRCRHIEGDKGTPVTLHHVGLIKSVQRRCDLIWIWSLIGNKLEIQSPQT